MGVSPDFIRATTTREGLPPLGLAPRPSSTVLVKGIDAQRTAAFNIGGLHDEGVGAGNDYSDVRGGSEDGVRQGTIG